jgi:hypothetical protein
VHFCAQGEARIRAGKLPLFPDPLEWYLADITNPAMKEFVDHISSLAPATIRDYVNIVKAVVASARDVRGEPLFMRDWDDEFIDVPEVDGQNQPTVDRDEMTAILQQAAEPYCVARGLWADAGRGSTRPRHSFHL